MNAPKLPDGHIRQGDHFYDFYRGEGLCFEISKEVRRVEVVADWTRCIVLAPDLDAAVQEAVGANCRIYVNLDEPRCQV